MIYLIYQRKNHFFLNFIFNVHFLTIKNAKLELYHSFLNGNIDMSGYFPSYINSYY